MYHFVIEKPDQNPAAASAEDRRHAELQNSDARSHAARIAYLKRIARQHISHHDEEVLSRWPAGDGAATRSRSSVDDRRGSASEITEEEASLGDQTRCQPKRKQKTSEGKVQSGRRQAGPAPKGNKIYSKAKFKLAPPSLLLAQTAKDPFDSFPERRLPENVEKVVQYAFDRIWPDMLCAVRGESLAVARSEWKCHALQDELLFHVQVALACGLNLALQNVPKVSETLALARLSHYSRAIRLLKERIEGLEGPASEALILSMLILGVNADVEEAMPEAHPQSPLATSQYMHLYGRLTLMPSYATAVHLLVEARGGIFKLKHLALADWLLLADLHHASRTGDRLRYPPLRSYHSIVATGRHVPDVKAKSFADKVGSGIHELEHSHLCANISKAMWNSLEAVVALDHYHRYENGQPRLVDVMLAANAAQRDFLELAPQEGLGLEHLVNSCCRLAALIFSDMVLFPMPSCTRIKPRLARELKQLLEDFDERPEVMEKARVSTSISDMLLWTVILGGIAASFTENRSWFLGRVQKCLESMTKIDPGFNAGTWTDVRRHVCKYLWWDPVMDEPAQELWKEVVSDMCQTGTEKTGQD